MPAKSLYKLAIDHSVAHIRQLDSVGDLPYDLVRPILLKVANPHQLEEIEKNSPQILGADGEIWLTFIRRDIKNWQEKRHEPKDPKKWWKVYRKLKNEDEEENKQQTAALKAKLDGIGAAKAGNAVSFDPNLSVKRKKKPTASNAPRSSADTSVLSFRSGSRTKDIIERSRREVREARLFRGSLATPTHRLAGTAGSGTNDVSSSQQSSVAPEKQAEESLTPQQRREQANARRQRALAQASAHREQPLLGKRNASNVFMPNKRRG